MQDICKRYARRSGGSLLATMDRMALALLGACPFGQSHCIRCGLRLFAFPPRRLRDEGIASLSIHDSYIVPHGPSAGINAIDGGGGLAARYGIPTLILRVMRGAGSALHRGWRPFISFRNSNAAVCAAAMEIMHATTGQSDEAATTDLRSWKNVTDSSPQYRIIGECAAEIRDVSSPGA
jgi:hypothetical protein